jgi:hypothetical protein
MQHRPAAKLLEPEKSDTAISALVALIFYNQL